MNQNVWTTAFTFWKTHFGKFLLKALFILNQNLLGMVILNPRLEISSLKYNSKGTAKMRYTD